MALVLFNAYVELDTPEQAELLFELLGDAICDTGEHNIDDPEHECGREFALFAGLVDDSQINWKEQLSVAFMAQLPKGQSDGDE
jgi:hypothetical protein